MSAIATRSELSAEQAADGGLGCMGGTYGGNAVCCAAALATLDVFRDEDVVGNSHRRGEQLRDGLRRVAANPATKGAIQDVRGLGLSESRRAEKRGGGGGCACVCAILAARGG